MTSQRTLGDMEHAKGRGAPAGNESVVEVVRGV